jgi:hypothetical protein
MRGKIFQGILFAAAAVMALSLAASGQAQSASPLPLADAHIHYSHDAWEQLPPKAAIRLLRQAGLKMAFVSSSSDDGTQMLHAAAPDLVVPVLRPYRRRGETRSWVHDESVVGMVAARLAKNTYAGIGEFHVFGPDADLAVMRGIVKLAAQYKIFLHAHTDADGIRRIFAQNPGARVLWAHSGFDEPELVADLLGRYKHLWADLAFRTDHATDGGVYPEWRKVFQAFPRRFMLGTDTYTPERWPYVVEHANWSRAWLADLPVELAKNIAYRNAEALANWALRR